MNERKPIPWGNAGDFLNWWFKKEILDGKALQIFNRYYAQYRENFDGYLKLAYVTDLEMEIANRQVQKLTSRWPFNESKSIRASTPSKWETLLQQTVDKVINDNFSFSDASYKLAEFLIADNRHNDPRKRSFPKHEKRIGAYQHQFAIGKVDEFQDAIDYRQPKRHQCVQTTQAQGVDQEL